MEMQNYASISDNIGSCFKNTQGATTIGPTNFILMLILGNWTLSLCKKLSMNADKNFIYRNSKLEITQVFFGKCQINIMQCDADTMQQ